MSASTIVSLSQRQRGQRLAAAAVVDYTNNIKLTKNRKIDALLAAGNHWWHSGTPAADGTNPSAAADHSLTYSFRSSATGLSGSDANGFQALSATQENVVRAAFSYISTVVNISFTEDSSGNGQLKLGSNNQGGSSSGYAYYPGSGSVGGSVFLANDQGTFSDDSQWQAGGYEWETIIHEIGHALGLKHPGPYNAGGGKTPGPYLGSLDNRSNSIMSYKDNLKTMHVVEDAGGGNLRAYNVNPDSYQAFDIAALQYLYGAPTSAQTTYQLDNSVPFSRTVFNNNSDSSIDLSAVTSGSILDLRGGHFSSIGVFDPYAAIGMTKKTYASLGSAAIKSLGRPTYSGASNFMVAEGSKIQHATGSASADSFVSGAEIGGPATLDGAGGDDNYFIASGDATISDTGGSANDTVYVVRKNGTTWTLSSDKSTLTQTNNKTGATLATITLSGIETVAYWNGKALKRVGKPLAAPALAAKAVSAYQAVASAAAAPRTTAVA